MTFFSTSEKIEIGGIPFVSNNIKPTRPEALEYYRRVAVSNKIKIQLQEKVINIHPANDSYEIRTSRRSYQTKNIILATGFYDIPVLMDVPGEELGKVTHYYKDTNKVSKAILKSPLVFWEILASSASTLRTNEVLD